MIKSTIVILTFSIRLSILFLLAAPVTDLIGFILHFLVQIIQTVFKVV